jgi:hypothetical protein
MISKVKRPTVVLVIILTCVSAASAQGPAKAERLRAIHLNGMSMDAVLAVLADDYGVTIGLETDPKKPKSEITLDLREVTFPDILNGIVQSEPRYQWREQEGFIEVFPVNVGLSLLDTPIGSFEVKDVNRDLAINRLLGLPEVRAQILSMNLKPRPPSPLSERTRDEKLSFNLNGVTLRQALNRIAQDSRANFWVFRRYDDGTFEIRLSCC